MRDGSVGFQARGPCSLASTTFNGPSQREGINLHRSRSPPSSLPATWTLPICIIQSAASQGVYQFLDRKKLLRYTAKAIGNVKKANPFYKLGAHISKTQRCCPFLQCSTLSLSQLASASNVNGSQDASRLRIALFSICQLVTLSVTQPAAASESFSYIQEPSLFSIPTDKLTKRTDHRAWSTHRTWGTGAVGRMVCGSALSSSFALSHFCVVHGRTEDAPFRPHCINGHGRHFPLTIAGIL